MWLVYLDESKENNSFYVYSAIIVDSEDWNKAFSAAKEFRQALKKKYGIYIRKELHAWKFAAGKGHIADRPISKAERAIIFEEVLAFVANAGVFKIISSVNTNEFYAFDRLINRINRTADAQKKLALIICDEGQEVQFTRRLRRMRVHNPIPSNQGTWAGGAATKNLTTDRIIEDPFFKDSSASYFIQFVDFCAYALLRSERKLESRTKLGYDKMYDVLRPITMSINNRADPRGLGIIR